MIDNYSETLYHITRLPKIINWISNYNTSNNNNNTNNNNNNNTNKKNDINSDKSDKSDTLELELKRFKLVKLGSIHIEGKNTKLETLNDLLTLKIIADNKVFICIKNLDIQLIFNGNQSDESNNNMIDNFLVSFENLLKNVFELVTNEQVPINITIRFPYGKYEKQLNCNLTDGDMNKCNSLFLSYFEEKQLLKYKQPKCNMSDYLRFVKPVIYWIYDDKQEKYEFHVSNCSKEE